MHRLEKSLFATSILLGASLRECHPTMLCTFSRPVCSPSKCLTDDNKVIFTLSYFAALVGVHGA